MKAREYLDVQAFLMIISMGTSMLLVTSLTMLHMVVLYISLGWLIVLVGLYVTFEGDADQKEEVMSGKNK